MERQQWSARCFFPGRVIVQERAEAHQVGIDWRDLTEGSRLGNGNIRAVCVWKIPGRWAGRCFHLGQNKEVFDAEVFAIYQASVSLISDKKMTTATLFL